MIEDSVKDISISPEDLFGALISTDPPTDPANAVVAKLSQASFGKPLAAPDNNSDFSFNNESTTPLATTPH